jgi:hypothetical protein
MAQDDQYRQQPKVNRRHHKEIHAADIGHTVAQKRLPRLAPPSWPTLGHVLGNRRLSDLDPELQQLAMNTRSTPQRVLYTHPSIGAAPPADELQIADPAHVAPVGGEIGERHQGAALARALDAEWLAIGVGADPRCRLGNRPFEGVVFGTEIREAFLLRKSPWEWLSLQLTKDALRGLCRLLEVPLAEMVKRRAQKQALPAAESHASIFEHSERLRQIAAGVRAPKVAIEIRILLLWLAAHCCRMAPLRTNLEMSSL